MSKLTKISIASVLTCATLLSCGASASTWYKYNSTSLPMLLVDKDSIQRASGAVRVWVLRANSHISADGALYEKEEYQIDCKKQTVQLVQQTLFDTDELPTEQVVVDNAHDIEPDSYEDAVGSFACDKSTKGWVAATHIADTLRKRAQVFREGLTP